MDEIKFWEIVQRAHEQSSGDMDHKCEVIKTIISKLSRDDAIGFARLFDLMMARAYDWRLWGAAYVIHGGCGDDSFSDFCSALISRGRRAFESALADPDSLAEEDFDEDSWFYEGFQYAVTDGVAAAVGSVPKREVSFPSEPSGEEWAEDDVYDLYPLLSKKFA
ncbi:DUF4240 domain-containing protein [Methylomonas sp. LL1]|uniref:DUF4240 domain-containing protein n=1 Tax=Methylomonas sp. LL1 TaxID=2785785 RepID=UPI0018C3C986|nr:DUF4240 domain-containing protein [Methylomonas sp. LL1]QPK65348.1 DUF4240 domain-containing protein [Methylomonas sp. LL1]